MDQDWTPLSDQPEWQNIQPEYEVNDTGVASITYNPAHREAQAYFKAIQKQKELSDRAIELTAILIDYNSANYTAWQYRWDCLVGLGKDLREEYEYTQLISDENAKNYQLWNHRRKCAFALGREMAADELKFAAKALTVDAKNYHAWAHRLAMVEVFDLWEQELAYTCEKIEEDVRNNSAWNQRLLVVAKLMASRQPDLLNSEVEFVIQQIRNAPRNESPWQYLRGLFYLQDSGSRLFSKHPQVFAVCVEVLSANASCAPALACLAEIYETLALRAVAAGQPNGSVKARDRAVELLSHLTVADPIRANYWTHRAKHLLSVVTE